MSVFAARNIRFAIAVATIGATALPPVPAWALELFGRCLIGKCESDVQADIAFIDPKNYSVDFFVESQDEDVIATIKSASALWTGKDKPVGGSAGLVARAKGDYRRILAALYNQGRYAGAISITVNGRQASDIRPGFDLPESSKVVVEVDPGRAYTFGKADIVNQAPPAIDPKDAVDLPADEGFAPGDVARAMAVRKAEKLAREAWRQQGHPLVEVEDRSATAVHPAEQLNVSIRLAPGPKAAFGEVYVEGAQRMDPNFIAYMTGIIAGEEYDPDEIKKAQKRLDRLGVFGTRKIEEAEGLTPDGLLPLNVVVSERKLRRIGVGATLSTVDGAGIETYWLHRNLFGKAEQLRLDAKISGIGGIQPDEYDYLLGATYTKPGVFSPDTDLVSNIFAKREFNETFTETSAGGSVLLKNYYSDEITVTAGAFANYGRFEDAFGDRRFFTTGLQSNVIYDNRDDKLDPTKGFYARLDAKPFYEWERGNFAARFEAEGRAYVAIDDEARSVFAARLKFGSIVGAGVNDVSPNLLFTAGGGNSVRGYGFKTIGIPAPGNEISGGRSLFEGSLEFRQRISKAFGVVAFVDAGTVSEASFVDFSEELRVGVGVGVRYYTGLGPIRLDVAIPLDKGDGDPGFAIYAGIGQSF